MAGVMAACSFGAHAQVADAAVSEPPARGFIVKLKARASTATGSSAAAPAATESAQSIRSRLASVAARARVSYLDSHPAGLARAHVLNYHRWLSADEAQATAQRLRQDPDVEWVVVNSLERPLTTSNVSVTDPYYVQSGAGTSVGGGALLLGQWWLKDRGYVVTTYGAQPGAPDIAGAWNELEFTVTRALLSPVVIAVLDSGITAHGDLPSTFLPGYDFVSEVDYANDGNGQDSDPTDPGDGVTSADKSGNPGLFSNCDISSNSWHGTLIAGQLGALTNNGTGVAGMLWQLPGVTGYSTSILPVRVAGKCGATVSDIIEGMLWASGVNYSGTPSINPNPARVVSLSYGGNGACNSAYQEAIDAMARAGAVLVAAAGNSTSGNGAVTSTRPATCRGVLGVTALRRNGSKADYADQVLHNPGIGRYGLATVGGDAGVEGLLSTTKMVISSNNVNSYAYVSGTSFAAPIAAGVAAMMLSVNPRISPAQLLSAMTTLGQGVNAFPAPTSLACAPSLFDSTQGNGNCDCASDGSTCGAGVLNAVTAVTWAYGTRSDTLNYSFVQPAAGSVSSSFVPEGSGGSSKSDGGGGGAAAPAWLAAVAVATGLLARQRRRAAADGR